MAIPLPVKENFPSAFVAWRLYEPDDSRISGLAITSDETSDYWSVNYTYLGQRFVRPVKGNQSKVRPILQSKTPPNAVLKRVTLVTIPTGEIKWQAQYKITSQLSATSEAEVELAARNIVKEIVVDEQTGINVAVKLTDPQSQEATTAKVEYSTKVSGFKECELQDKVSCLKLIKNKVKDEMIRPSSGNFISVKHKNKFFALLRIARKAIISKTTTSTTKKETKDSQINARYGKGAEIYQKQKQSYNSVPPPSNLSVNPNLKYFEGTDLSVVVAMGILYDKPEKYFHGNYRHYERQVHVWAINTLMKNGIPIFSKEDGMKVFPHVMARTGLSETYITSIGITEKTIVKGTFVHQY